MKIEARDYLETVLPALLSGPAIECGEKETIIQLLVSDLSGCEYFYRIAGSSVEARRGVSDRVDLTVSFTSRDLEDLFNNALDVARAVRTKRIEVYGDEEVLKWLSLRLAA